MAGHKNKKEQKMTIGGVIHNSTASWLIEEADDGISVEFEVHKAECPEEDHVDCWESQPNETLLINFIECSPDDKEAWFGHKGEFGEFGYKPDPNAEYSAIMGEIYTQVVRSKYVINCALCSPCYPGQGDLDNTYGDGYETYSLPPSMFGEDGYPVEKISRKEL
jgi:hypothetical protein